jgi:hypothetical protein
MSGLHDRELAWRLVNRRLFVSQLVIVAALSVVAGIGYAYPERVGSLWFALLFGMLGASLGLQRRGRGLPALMLDELASDALAVARPLVYGGLMAGVTYLLFLAGILSGDGGGGMLTSNLFPAFTASGGGEEEILSVKTFVAMRPQSLADFAKLVIWCFLAGWSERFVSGVLGRLGGTVGADDPDEPARGAA